MNPILNGNGNWNRIAQNQVMLALPLAENDASLRNMALVQMYCQEISIMYPRVTSLECSITNVDGYGETLVIVVTGFIDKPF